MLLLVWGLRVVENDSAKITARELLSDMQTRKERDSDESSFRVHGELDHNTQGIHVAKWGLLVHLHKLQSFLNKIKRIQTYWPIHTNLAATKMNA